ncbi:hypothetical protein PUNSTDRAFT_49905 [Punctularia strigosozonata HHB-11173 SS5]|uniref:uncharacterized protein n=1 Tax=Punctularia strigosozonata (strain HHB-11173) TaxID=741275 RepID=UPI00044183AF|nr:uncharacterized protein PUNSTDRAFT_49905 [Punctularia strigosozonata HHB-11173 SS5]EIN12606.1 hypothetical protein PUNSTDRAFT_49905 [Punctularia strigosozonata HHB-11173 SS5]
MSTGIVLHLRDQHVLPGERLAGTVDVDFDKGLLEDIEQIKVKIRGSIQTVVYNSTGVGTNTYPTRVELIRADIPLWERDQTSPQTGTLTFPFDYQLPSRLLPSFHAKGGNGYGNITYFVEVVGSRPGLLHRSRRVRSLFSVLPVGSREHDEVRRSLTRGWGAAMPWKACTRSKSIREGVWGGYSQVDVNLRVPDVLAFPLGTPIPIKLDIITTTKSYKASEPGDEKDGEPMFPAPPMDPTSLKLRVDRETTVNSKEQWTTVKARITDLVCYAVGFGPEGKNNVSCNRLRVWQDAPEWIPAPDQSKGQLLGRNKERQVCRRASHFETVIELACPPSFKTDTLEAAYFLRLRVPFPGVGNDVKCEIPLNIVAGSMRSRTSIADSDTDKAGFVARNADERSLPPYFETTTVLDLPPAYWSAEDYIFEADEKD